MGWSLKGIDFYFEFFYLLKLVILVFNFLIYKLREIDFKIIFEIIFKLVVYKIMRVNSFGEC